MAVKIYKTINPGNLSVMVKGIRILFNASTMHSPGIYSTGDEDFQRAIEADPCYGKEFKLAYSSSEDKPKAAGRPKGSAKPKAEANESEQLQ
jgi:hypothetical protein